MNTVRKSDQWLQTHRATIGGSNAAAAVGLGYKTRLALYYEMVEGHAEDLEGNTDVLRGLILEPVARQRLSDALGMEIIEHDQDDFIRNEKYPFAHALPDGWIVFEGARIPIEIKVPRPENWRKLDAEIPDVIQCQAVHNAAVIGAPALMLVCMCPVTLQLFRQLYTPVQDSTDALMGSESEFIEKHIVPRIPPPPQTHEDLKLRWPEATAGTRVMATKDIEEAWSELVAVRATAKHAEERKEDLSFIIKNFMCDAENLIGSQANVIATWRSHLRSAFDGTRFKEAHPELWAAYAEDRPQRTFLVKLPK